MRTFLFLSILLLQTLSADNNSSSSSITENVKNTIMELVAPQKSAEDTARINNTIREKKEVARKKEAELALERVEAEKLEKERHLKE